MPRPRQIKRELRRLVTEKRQRDEAKKPCTACGRPLFGPDGRLDLRLIGVSEEPCETCDRRAAELAPNRQLHIQIPFASPDLDPEAEQLAGDLAFLAACRFDYGLSDQEIRQRYEGVYEDLDGLLAQLDSDGPDEAA
jgi:hypothetical protein